MQLIRDSAQQPVLLPYAQPEHGRRIITPGLPRIVPATRIPRRWRPEFERWVELERWQMAITETNRANFSTTTDAAAFSTSAFTPTASRILCATVLNTKGSSPNTVNTFTDTGGLTWTQIHTVVDTGDLRRITQYWAPTGAGPGSITVTADFNSVNQTGCFISIAEFDGLNLVTPIGNKDTRNPGGTANTQALTLAFGNANNGVYLAIGYNINEAATVSNCQSIANPNISTPTMRLQVGWDAVNQVAPGCSWTTAGVRFGAGFELVASGSSVVPIFVHHLRQQGIL